MSSSYTGPLDRLAGVLDELAGIGPEFRSTAEKQQVLVGLSRLIARAEAARLRVLAAAEDIAEATGERSTAAWLADQTRQPHGTVRRHASLATALDDRWVQVGEALAAGAVNLAQTRVIVEALEALPTDLGADLLVKAEALLVAEAAELGPRELRVFGSRLLDHLAPEIAEEADYQRLLAQEARAHAATRLTWRPRGDGSTDLHARLPDQVASRLRAYLDAYTAPRRHHRQHRQHRQTAAPQDTVFGPLAPTEPDQPAEPAEPDEFAQLPLARQRGIGFTALLENIPTGSLPRHGGTATSVLITLDDDTLIADLDQAGIAQTSTGDPITAGQARRLACQANILPVVLGQHSEILDLGRESRLYQPHQRKAMNLRDQACTTLGCTVPAAFCEAHHTVPWSQGGNTDLKDGTLLCPFHHHRAHHPNWTTTHHPHGTTTFTRRQ